MLEIGVPRTAREFAEYYDLRWRVLRAPWQQPRGSERDDDESSAHHVTARTRDGRLVAVGRIHFTSADEARIRYMATAPDWRGCGAGRAIAERLEQIAVKRGAARIVLDARSAAIGFYLRLGYEAVGPGPTLFGAIEHSRMRKRLAPTDPNRGSGPRPGSTPAT